MKGGEMTAKKQEWTLTETEYRLRMEELIELAKEASYDEGNER